MVPLGIINIAAETYRMPFLMLGLDLPEPPLFKDVMEKNIIPRIPLFNMLKKFDGETVTTTVCLPARMRYRVTRLPQYLMVHMSGFTKNNFFREKNPTLVNFPVKNLELDYIPLPPPTKENEKLCSKYDLIANIVHDGMKCRICMFLKHFLRWLHYLKPTCGYTNNNNSSLQNLIN